MSINVISDQKINFIRFRSLIPSSMYSKSLKQFLFLLTMLLLSNTVEANETQFEAANQLYQAAKYQEAITSYEAILQADYKSTALYYNLGNCYFKTGKFPKAILNFERALRLSPSDEDIQFNLQMANEELKDEIEAVPSFFLSKWWNAIRNIFSSTIWAVLSLILLWVGIWGIAAWIKGTEREQKKKSFLLGLTGLVLSILPFLFALSARNNELDSKAAIIMKPEVVLRAAPDPSSAEIVKLHEGTKVRLKDKIESFHKVILANGEQGWLEMSVLEKI